ncbi:MAG: hypothetical protein E6342_17635 [Clostridium sp.]|uniref:hypothetical protein n=1 Tax=Clostridium sp. TaxID=1506 RepID=UPI0029122EF7|nr:hypothetical protein [Clostridium sp.]MDU4843982.1 hypothetical protein [Leclercia adecarboxylata]MDU7089511.1 hypothetical protein [Clostridium sp.]
MVLENILTFSIGTISVSTCIVFIAKAMFNKWIDVSLEKYKSKLNLELEEYKIEKQRVSDEYTFKFTKLHEERAIVIRELYSKLLDVENYISLIIKSIEEEGYDYSYVEKLHNSISPYIKYSNKNKIFFDEDIVHSLKEINAIIILIFNFLKDGSEDLNDETITMMRMMLKEAIPEFKEKLEVKFREILGVN